jgi:two-component system, chemotaxis family, CheB/CheR fusion protein
MTILWPMTGVATGRSREESALRRGGDPTKSTLTRTQLSLAPRAKDSSANHDGEHPSPASKPARQAERRPRKLGSSGADLDKLLVSTNLAMLLLDRQMCIRRFTPAATALFSLLPSDIGRPIRDLSQKFGDPSFDADVLLVLQGGEGSKKEIHSDEGRWYVRQTLPYLLGDGSVGGIVITFSDIAADALQEARLYSESIVNTVREPLLVLDADLHVHSINQPFSVLFEVSSQDVLGCLLPEIGGGAWHIPALLDRFRDVLGSGSSFEGLEFPFHSPKLGQRALLLNGRILHRGGSRPDLILIAIEDVTERRRVDTLLREKELRDHEEEHIRSRQRELNNAQRVSTVGELATGLAHELNQPLASIANVVEACSRYVRAGIIDPAKLLELLDDVGNQAMRAAGIVAHLRSFVDKGEPQLEDVDLVDVVSKVPNLMRYELERTRVELFLDLPTGPLVVQADRIQIEQVIVNLIQNAMDSIEEAGSGERKIVFRARTAGAMVELCVRDTGTGVLGAAADRIFEPFFTTKTQGLGMGLALSRSILEAHAGRIWMEPLLDGTRGANVCFALPLQTTKRRARERKR